MLNSKRINVKRDKKKSRATTFIIGSVRSSCVKSPCERQRINNINYNNIVGLL